MVQDNLRLYQPGNIPWRKDEPKIEKPRDIKKELEQAYIESILTPGKKPVYEAGDIVKDVKEQKGWRKIAAGIAGSMKYLGTSEGSKFLAPLMKGADAQTGMIRQAEAQQPYEMALKQAYQQREGQRMAGVGKAYESMQKQDLKTKELQDKAAERHIKEENRQAEMKIKKDTLQIRQDAESRAAGTAIAKKKEKADLKQIEKDNLTIAANDQIASIDQIEKGIQHFGKSAMFPFIPGTERKDWKGHLDKFLSGLVLDVMSDLKRASATGSTGFGQLSEKELQLLYDAATALKATTSEKEAKRLLGNLREKFQLKISRLQQGITGDDVEAIEWANANPEDPRAKEILGMQGGR